MNRRWLGWLTPDGKYWRCGGANGHHQSVATAILDAHFPSTQPALAIDAQDFLLRHGYVRIDADSVMWDGDAVWKKLTADQVWTLRILFADAPRGAFPHELVRLILVNNGVEMLRQPGDEQRFAMPFALAEPVYNNRRII